MVISLALIGLCAFYFGSNITQELISTRVDSQNVAAKKSSADDNIEIIKMQAAED